MAMGRADDDEFGALLAMMRAGGPGAAHEHELQQELACRLVKERGRIAANVHVRAAWVCAMV